jgi:phage protein D
VSANQDAPAVTLAIRKLGEKDAQPFDLADRLISLAYEDNALILDEAVITLDNWELDLFDNPLFRLRNEIDISWGYAGDMSEPRRCVITSISGGRVLTIRANGQAVAMNNVTKSRTWKQMTVSDVVKKIAGEYGFGTDTYVEDTKVAHEQITQARCTDARFIRHLADKEGFEFHVSRGQLHFHRAKLDQEPVKRLVWTGATRDADPNSMFVTEPSISEELKGKVGAIAHVGIDPSSKKLVKVSASNSEHKDPTLGTTIEAWDRPTRQNLGQREVTETEHTSPTARPTESGAKRDAAAAYHKNRKNLIRIKFTVVGDHRLTARSLVEISGIGSRLSGKWYVVKAPHRPVGGGPYLTEMECSRDAHFGYADRKRDAKAGGALNRKEAKDGGKDTEPFEGVDRSTRSPQPVSQREKAN